MRRIISQAFPKRSTATQVGRCTALVGALLTAGWPESAHADEELWLWSEMRLPLASQDEFPVRTTFRLFNDVRFSRRRDGLQQAFTRVGPLFDLTPWVFVALNATVYADHLADGTFQEERRAEIEPTFHWRIGDFGFLDRNRLEYRWRDTGDGWRYRNQLRVNYVAWSTIVPFVWDEVLVQLSDEGFHQNRLQGGIGIVTSKSTRIDVAYMLRSRKEPEGWINDHVGVLYLFYDGWAR